MATLSANNPTLIDVASRLDPTLNIDKIVELLAATNPVLNDMTFMEGNLPTGHKTTVRTGLPGVTWRKLYGGVQPSKSRTAQVTDSCGMLEAYAEVDKALADLNGNAAAFRLSEDKAFIEARSQEMASTLFYGNETTEPEAFTGFAPRYNSLSAQNGDNIVNASGSGSDNTSIWLVVWGAQHLPRHLPEGLDRWRADARPVRGDGGERRRRLGPRADVPLALPLGLRLDAARLALRGAHRQHRRVGSGYAGQHQEPDHLDDPGC